MSLKSPPSDIAIVGMSVLLPGAQDLRCYWHNILNKTDCLQDAPDAWAAPYFDPGQSLASLDSARIYTRKVGLIQDLAKFNPLDFGIPPKAVEGDPAHFLTLALAKDALRDANYLERSFNREATGIVVGRGANPNRGDTTGLQYGLIVDQTLSLLQQLLPTTLSADMLASLRQSLKASLPAMEIDQAPSLVSNVVTGRIANRLDLMGPNYLVDAACSSSLIAVAHAIDDLISGRSDMMLAGGVQASMPPQIYMLFCQLKALSRGNIRPFDETASGTILGEGVGFLVLKRLADAKRDNDRIYAVIKGVGISSDGKAQGLLAPRFEGQVLALERAYRQTGIDPNTISLIEAHGTGIPLGDRTEIQTLSKIFGGRRGKLPDCAIGSVKSMIGHCIPASGIASLAKTALALYHKVLPPTLCDQVNANLNLEKTPFYINNELRPWIHPSHKLRRAGVNAFGFGGINAHAILEEVDERPSAVSMVGESPSFPTQTVWAEWPSELLVLAASSPSTLIAKLQQVQTFLSARSDINLSDVAYTLAAEATGDYRLAVVVKSLTDAERKLAKAMEKLQKAKGASWQIKGSIFYSEPVCDRGKTAFLFSTEGSQYANMLADLCLYFPQARTWFDFLDETFERTDRPSQVIFSAPTGLNEEQKNWSSQELFAADLATETVSTGSLAIYEILKAFKLPCDVMVGHSAGEHVALRAAGMVSVESRSHLKQLLQKLNQVYSQLETEQAIPTGTLLSVGAVAFSDIEKLLSTYAGTAHLVADNCPNQILIFVAPEKQGDIIEFVKQLGGICTPLPFNRAYHTPLFEHGTEALRAYYKDIELGSCDIPVYSCASTEPYPKNPEAIRNLSAEQWSLPVRFRETIEQLYTEGVRTFIEVGAGNNLTNFVNNILQDKDCLAMPTNVSRRPGLMQLQALIGRVWSQGKEIDFTPFYGHRPLQKVDWQQLEPLPEPFSLSIKMLLPRIQLSSEQAAQFQEKILQTLVPTANAEPQPPSVSQPQTVTSVPPQPPQTAQLPTVPSPAPPPNNTIDSQAVKSQTAGSLPLAPQAQTSQAQQQMLSAHFDLMQTFLNNQAAVSTQLFQQLAGPSPSPSPSPQPMQLSEEEV